MTGTKPWPEVGPSNRSHTSAAVVIIGAGISGMCTAIDLIKTNKCHNFVILEKSSGVGGTWHDNKYPGCCCDVWSMLYSYSFEQNPDWTREYPGQEEILDYLMRTAAKYNLYKYIRFNSTVNSAEWDDSARQWKTTVSVASGSKDSEFVEQYDIRSDFLVSAVGQLNQPKYPDIDGLKSFQGRIMHSARWDWGYSLQGKKVAIIGNGATAAQIIPEIAKEVSHLTVFQRTPNWVIPRLDSEITPLWRTLYKTVPGLQARVRAAQMDFREGFFGVIEDPDGPVAQVITGSCIDQMHAALPDQPETWEKLTPKYKAGCKRIIISDDYYPTLALPHVTLETGEIARITEKGIATHSVSKNISSKVSTADAGSAGFGINDDMTPPTTSVETGSDPNESEQEFDMIILATGFKTVDFMHPIDFKGENGTPLSTVWKDGASAYMGMTVPHMNNMAILYGPNSNLGHNSIILMIEAQSRYINALIGAVLHARTRALDASDADTTTDNNKKPLNLPQPLALMPKEAATHAYNEKLQARLATSAFADPRCGSWYKDPRTGKITNNWSGNVVEYQEMLSKVNWNDYEGGETVIEMKRSDREVVDFGAADEWKGVTWLGRVREETVLSDKMLAGLSAAALGAVAFVGWVLRNQTRLNAVRIGMT